MTRRRAATPYFAAAGLLAILAVLSQFELRAPSRPVAPAAALRDLAARNARDADVSVVFVLVDTLRADRLGVYGYSRDTSPNLDALASHGIVFEDVVSQSSWTKTSMVSLWTGTYPANHGVLRYDQAIPEAAVLPAEIFRDAGYRTVGIWRNGWVEPNFGFAQGFDVYVRPTPGLEKMKKRRRAHRSAHESHSVLSGSDEDVLRWPPSRLPRELRAQTASFCTCT